MKYAILLFPVLLTCWSHAAAGEELAFTHLPVQAVAGTAQHFSARGKQVEILFQSFAEPADPTVDAFPEPPVRLRDRQGNSICDISQGGIWMRNQVYLDRSERYLLLSEYSGSSTDLVAYDTRNCQPIRRLDVSGARWEIEGAKARLGEECSGATLQSCQRIGPLDLRIFALPG